jgi:hypothetical protein
VAVADVPVNITSLLKAIGDAAPGRKKLAVTSVTGWLVREGYLKSLADTTGRAVKRSRKKAKGRAFYGDAGRHGGTLFGGTVSAILGLINKILSFVQK